jgi:hypothetical protein
MRATKSLMAMLVVLSFATLAYAADDPNVGSWKLNESKSKIPAGATMNTNVTYTMEGDQYKCVTEGKDGQGNAIHSEWTGKFDGKDYPVTGEANADTRSVKKTGTGYMLMNKMGGKPTVSGKISFSKDNKTRTLTLKGHDAAGKAWTGTYVYDRV